VNGGQLHKGQESLVEIHTGALDVARCGEAMAGNEEGTSTIAIVPFRGRGRGARRGATW
jgi:hypothetical protein